MEILVIDSGRINKYTLSNNSVEDFSISYKPVGEKSTYLITLVKDGENWWLNSNGNVNVIQENFTQGRVKLDNYSKYNLKIVGLDNVIELYVLPNVNERLYRLDCQEVSQIVVGNVEGASINYRNDNIKDTHFVINKKDDGKVILSVNDDVNNYKIYVNNYQILNDVELNVGDLIFVEGLKLIWMDEFIEINSPNNMVQVSGLGAYTKLLNEVNNNFVVSNFEEKNVELYKEMDCFFHIPRIREEIKEEEVIIDAPPASVERDELPFFLTLGSTITMSASSLMMAWNVGYGYVAQSKQLITLIPQIVMCIAMILGSLVMPRLTKNYQKRKIVKNEKLRQTKYTEYLKSKEVVISSIVKNQEQIMRDNNLSIEDCVNVISSKNKNLWSRQIVDNDFLTVRLGIGSCDSKISIKAPEEHFSLDVDNLLQDVYEMVDKYKKLVDVPIGISLVDRKIVSFIFDNKQKYKYIEGLLIQLVALHSPIDLKIVIITNEEHKDNWDYAKRLAHCLSNDKSQRFFSTTLEQAKEISNYLVEELKNRNEDKNMSSNSNTSKFKEFSPYYLIITDDYGIAKETKIVEDIMEDTINWGFSLVAIDNYMKNLPVKSEIFVNVGQNDGVVIDKNMSADSQLQFLNEYNSFNINELCRIVSNVPVSYRSAASILPQSLTFLEMYGVSKIEQLNISNRWKTNNPVTNLNAPIGVHASGDLFKLNLHEKFHGPHGLVAGSTGSGKSEFIITYILSMAINYHPYEVQFVLIDYKGGGLAGAFENKEKGIKLPHLAGTITNLDTSEMNRTLVSIQSELKRRQRRFNEVRDRIGASTIDIYKYQQLYREGVVDTPMSHLFIISDEFAELKSQQPEFMQQLISTARIGRSLGVHLILATQKPSGVVNDQIWSNSKFKVCLKVQDRADSMEMLKRPEAASIKEAGRFYLQVGYDDYFDIGQSGWSGAKYVPSDQIIKKIDDSINFIDNVGNVIKTVNEVTITEENKVDMGDQLTNLVKYICDLSARENLVNSTLWLDSIPELVDLNLLKQKYNYQPIPYCVAPVIGEYDNPVNQEQGIINLDLMQKGNTLIYGKNGSGKEHLLTTIVWSSIVEHTPDEVNIYILDYGAEVLKIFNKFPHVGGIFTADDSDKVFDLMQMIEKEIEVRKELFADYGGNYVDYINSSGNKLPLLLVIINNYEIFCENNNKLSESIQSFYRDGSKYGIVFVISTISINSIRSRMFQNFVNKICLQLQNDLDYRNVLKAPKGLVPSKMFGRGLIEMNDTAYEFQTATIIDKNNLNNLMKEAKEKLNKAYISRAKVVPSLPDVVSINNLDIPTSIDDISIGYNVETKNQVKYNFEKDKINQIITNAMNEDKINFIYALIKIMAKITNVVVIDFVNAIDKKIDGIVYINNNFDNALNELNSKVFSVDAKKVCFVLGGGLLKEELSPNSYNLFTNILSNVNEYKGLNFVFIDTYNSFKKLQVEDWYQLNVNHANGIWLGRDISTQILINVTDLSLEDRKLDFYCMAFSINNGSRTIIKHVVDMEVNDEK